MYKFVVSSVLLVIAVAGLGYWSLHLESSLKDANDSNADLVKKLEAKAKILTTNENMYHKTLNEKDEELNKLKRLNESLGQVSQELAEAKEALKAKDTAIETEKSRVNTLTEQVSGLTEKNQQFEKELTQQRDDYKRMVGQLTEQTDALTEARKAMDAYSTDKTALELALKTAQDKCRKLAADLDRQNKLIGEKIDGKVQKTAVSSEVAPGFIIIGNLTKKPEVGLKLSVFHQDEFVGQVEVTRAFESSAGAQITYLAKGREIKVGDKVLTGFPAPVPEASQEGPESSDE